MILRTVIDAITNLRTYNYGEPVNSYQLPTRPKALSQLAPLSKVNSYHYQNEMYDFDSILEEISVRTQRKEGFSIGLDELVCGMSWYVVRVGMWYELVCGTSWHVVRVGMWYELVCGMSWYVVRVGMWYELVCGTSWHVVRVGMWYELTSILIMKQNYIS